MSSSTQAWVYPKECNLCSKHRIQFKRTKYVPYKIETHDAEMTIKAAAKDKNETLYNEIKDLDLIAKEFKVHKHCYQHYTTGYAAGSRSKETDANGTTEPESSYSAGKFEEVKQFVDDEVLGLGKAVSMKVVHEIYDLEVGDKRYRHKLKKRLQNHYKEKISFVTPKGKAAEVLIPSDCLDGSFLNYCATKSIQAAANYLRDEILNKFKDLPELDWPPSLEQLSDSARTPPESLHTFLDILINQSNHHLIPSANIARIVESLAQDITSAVTRGKYIQPKQFLLGQGLHNLTGSRKVIDIVHKLGHCIPYNTVCEIETAQAECALEAAKQSSILKLKPASSAETVFTYYWVDNFDVKVERMGGGGSINTTHLMAFQEDQNHEKNVSTISVPRKKSRKLFYEDINIERKQIDVNKGPENIKESNVEYSREKEVLFNKMHFVWAYARKQNSFNQVIPIFKGWTLNIRTMNNENTEIKKTVETFLPPITSKVTEFSTIQKYLSYLQNLSESVNMPYVNVTLDVGAAISAYKTIWNFPEMYKNVIIHLGSFHFLKENFQV